MVIHLASLAQLSIPCKPAPTRSLSTWRTPQRVIWMFYCPESMNRMPAEGPRPLRRRGATAWTASQCTTQLHDLFSWRPCWVSTTLSKLLRAILCAPCHGKAVFLLSSKSGWLALQFALQETHLKGSIVAARWHSEPD